MEQIVRIGNIADKIQPLRAAFDEVDSQESTSRHNGNVRA